MNKSKTEVAILVLEQQSILLNYLQKINANYIENTQSSCILINETLETINIKKVTIESSAQKTISLNEEMERQKLKYDELKQVETELLFKLHNVQSELKTKEIEAKASIKALDQITNSTALLQTKVDNYNRELSELEKEISNQKEIASLGNESNELLRKDAKKLLQNIFDKKVELKQYIERAKEEYQKLNLTTAQFYEINEIETTLFTMSKKMDKYRANSQLPNFQQGPKQEV